VKLRLLGIALLAASAASLAQTPSGSAIQPRPLPQPLPSTSADTQGTSPRTPETSAGASGTTPDNAGRSSGRCDSLIGEERNKCLREQASTGSAGAGSTGIGSGATR
jgi:hypothetical protein